MKKRILALLLAAVMVMAMVPAVFAAEITGTCGENLTWSKSADGTLTISGTGDMTNYNMTTTGALVNLKSLAGEFTSVVVESGVTSIGDDAFSYCDTLESVTIGDTVTKIGIHTFANCEALERVDLPASLTEVGLMAFNQCNELSDVYYAGTQEEWDSIDFGDGNEPLTEATIHFAGEEPAKNQIGDNITWELSGGTLTLTGTGEIPFFNTSIESITGSFTAAVIGSGITRIGNSTFFNCDELTTVTIPVTVTAIDDLAFAGCTALTDVYYEGTEAQWAAIKIGSSNEALTKAALHCAAEPEPDTGFTDVPAGEWYAKAVTWAVAQNITNGTGDGKFSPKQQCTQAEIITFLWRAAGEPEPAAAVTGTEFYAKAVQWAKEKGIIDGSFELFKSCTRQTAVTYMWKYAGSPTDAPAASFPDVPAGSDFAKAVAWALQQGVTTGTDQGLFLPETVCDRGQIVTFLYRAFA